MTALTRLRRLKTANSFELRQSAQKVGLGPHLVNEFTNAVVVSRAHMAANAGF